MNLPSNPRRPGFTLIELLVAMAIIGAMIALLLPAVNNVREAARRCQCVNNLVQINIAIQNYDFTHEMFPPGVVNPTGPIANTPSGYHMSWVTQILPFMEQKNAFKKINFRAGVYDPSNVTVREHVMNSFICPSDNASAVSNKAATNNYAACHNDVEAPIDAGNKGVFFLNSHIRYDDVTDGTANTIFVGEKLRDAKELGWMSGTRATLRNAGHGINLSLAVLNGLAGDDDEEDDAEQPRRVTTGDSNPSLQVGGFGSKHGGGADFAFGDGSVRFIRAGINSKVLRLLCNRADGELIGGEEF